jgi:hypothetical protein
MSQVRRGFCGTCGKRACFNHIGVKFGIRCKAHIETGMIDVTKKKCISPNCDKNASHCKPGETKSHCKNHASPDMVIYRSPSIICNFKNCEKTASQNFSGEKKVKFCKEHALPGMVNIKAKLCIVDGCKTQASYNEEGKTPLYCKEHSTPTMILLKRKKCKTQGCNERAIYNNEGETSPLYCSAHSQDDMKNVANKKCLFPGCTLRPSFNDKESTGASWCKEHSTKDMINVNAQICIASGCEISASFGTENENKKLYCSAHASPEMIDLVSNICVFSGCRKNATQNIFGEKRAKYCKSHADGNMVNVKDKKCEICSITAQYGIPGTSSTRCYSHIEEGMLKSPNKRCENFECKEKASYGYTKPVFCEQHASSDQKNLLLKKCVYCNSIEICNKEGYCYEYCITTEYHNKAKKFKELRVYTLLKNEVKKDLYLMDKIINVVCNKKRPDFIYDCGTYFLVIEVDEHQHRAYGCELNRMYLVAQALGMPVIFLRYNPDDFKDEIGKKSAITQIKREEILIQWVNYLMNLEPKTQEEYLRSVYLFYDEYRQTTENIENIKLPDNFFDFKLIYDLKESKCNKVKNLNIVCISDINSRSNIGSIPNINNISSIPNINNISSIPNINNISSIPNINNISSIPNINNLANNSSSMLNINSIKKPQLKITGTE